MRWGVEELDADLPRARPRSGRDSGVLATEIGGRRASAQVRRGFVVHREHEIASKVSRRLRKRETRLGKVLTVIKNASRRRIAFGVDLGDVFLGESLCDRLGDWSRGSRGSGGRYLKPPWRADQAKRRIRAAVVQTRQTPVPSRGRRKA